MDSMDLVKIIKKAAIDAVNASKPANVVFGKVIGVDPLRIQIDQKLILGKAQLVISEHLTDHVISVDAEDTNTTKNVVIHNALVAGDNVIMIRVAGGQKYVVFDRIGGD